jgi:hypothetical protein
MEPTFRSNNDFYDYVDSTVIEMRQAGLNKEAERLDFLLHKVAWTTSSELFGELGLSILKILDLPNLSPPIRSRLQHCIAGVRVVWPDIGEDPMGLHRRIRLRDEGANGSNSG